MNVWERKRPRERKNPFAPSQWCGGCSSLLVLLWFPGVFCRASLFCQVSVHLPWRHNFRFQSSFQILLAENFHNFFVQIFCIFFPILFPGLVSSGCEGFMVPSFPHCFVSSSPTFWPCLCSKNLTSNRLLFTFPTLFPPGSWGFWHSQLQQDSLLEIPPTPRSWGPRHEVALDRGNPRNWRSAGCAEFRVAARVSDSAFEPFSS